MQIHKSDVLHNNDKQYETKAFSLFESLHIHCLIRVTNIDGFNNRDLVEKIHIEIITIGGRPKAAKDTLFPRRT